jgi:trehalose synthase
MNDPFEKRFPQVKIEDYEQFVGPQVIERVRAKMEKLQDIHITNISSTYYGGGVAELLSSITLLMNSSGISTGWRILQGTSDFFGITKKMHNALQGSTINLTDRKTSLYEEVIYENALRNHIRHDFVIVHDPQPLPIIRHYKKNGPWIWRCHLDLSSPNPILWNYLRPFVDMYDAVIVSIPEYLQKLNTPQFCFMPAVDPFTLKNRQLSEKEIQERLNHYNIPTDLPLVVQISRFDRFKDPEGVIEAFEIARKQVDATLVLLGAPATDDPEGAQLYDEILESRSERIIIMSQDDTALVNALQQKAAVVLQKSIKEGFGLTVSEAMWKGTPVIGGNVGGIRYQIEDGVNGYLVSSINEAAMRIVEILKNPDLRHRLGKNARKTVQEKFLLIRLFEQYLDLFNSFETIYRTRSEVAFHTNPLDKKEND